MTEKDYTTFIKLLEKLVDEDDMANMHIINKANELLELINEL